MGILAMHAQSKAEQIKQIRQIYADAKKKVADNGKGATPRLDVVIHKSDTMGVSEDFIMEEEAELKIFFSKVADPDEWYTDMPYFISYSWSENGHTTYREILYEPQKGYPLFSYMKAETHAGFVVETRYYYDEKGGLVDQKHKVGGADATADSHTWSSWDTDLKMARQYMEIFKTLMAREDPNSMTVGSKVLKTTKADRLKMIRSNYSKAKDAIAKVEKSDFKTGVTITIHDCSDTEGPPITREYNFFFDKLQKAGPTTDYHCYFLSEHSKSMYFDTYEEFLFHPTSDALLFYYDKTHEEDMLFEVRLYYDDNGKCFDHKQNTDINDFDFFCLGQRAKAKKLLTVFRSMFD